MACLCLRPSLSASLCCCCNAKGNIAGPGQAGFRISCRKFQIFAGFRAPALQAARLTSAHVVKKEKKKKSEKRFKIRGKELLVVS